MKYLYFILIAILFYGCGKSNDKDEQNQKRDLLVDQIRKEYNILTEDDIENFRYTVQYTEAFIDSSYLFLIEPFLGIDDFLYKNGKPYIRVSSWFPTIYFKVECDIINFDKLFNIFRKDEYKEILLVVKINNIEKMFLTTDTQNDGVDNYIELDYSSSFVANAQLIIFRLRNRNE